MTQPQKERAGPGKARELLRELLEYNTDDCIRWPFYADKGRAKIHDPTRGYSISVARAMCDIKRGTPLPSYILACHTCNNSWCVNHNHCVECSHKENTGHRQGHGTHGTKLTEPQAVAIYLSSKTHRSLATLYGVSTSLISKIKCGKLWIHVSEKHKHNKSQLSQLTQNCPDCQILIEHIVEALLTPEFDWEDLALKFSVPLSTINNIRYGRRWNALKRELGV